MALSEQLDYSEKLLKCLKLIKSIVENIFQLTFRKMKLKICLYRRMLLLSQPFTKYKS